MTAGDTMLLSVQLEHADRPRQPIRDMRIDYSKRWQHQHWTAIVSAYHSSPYFDHYADRLEPLYRKPWRYLVDMNCELLDTVLSILHRTDRMPRLSTQYVACTESDTDLRDKKRGATIDVAPYVQVFSDRQPFVANLSIVDLLLCEGPESVAILESCRL